MIHVRLHLFHPTIMKGGEALCPSWTLTVLPDGIRGGLNPRPVQWTTSRLKDGVVTDCSNFWGRGRFKCDGSRAEPRFRLSAKRTSRVKSAGTSVQSITGSRGVRISGSNAGYTVFRGSVKGTGYPLHSPVSPSLPLPCVTTCHHISTGMYSEYTGRLLFMLAVRECGHSPLLGIPEEILCTAV